MLSACCLYITTTHLPKEGEGEDRTALQPRRHFCSPLLPLCPATPLTPGASLPQTASAQVARSSETPGMNIRGARNGTECLSKRSWGSFQALDSSNQKLFFSTMDETHFRGASCTQRPLQPTATIQEVAYFFTSRLGASLPCPQGRSETTTEIRPSLVQATILSSITATASGAGDIPCVWTHQSGLFMVVIREVQCAKWR